MRSPTQPTLEQRLRQRQRPQQSVVMYQRWEQLLFLHWEIDPALIQKTLPAGLHVDTYNDKAYIGIVPFYMRNVRPRFVPPIPGISHFEELNCRTYVYDDNGTPGVWFYSLEAYQWLAVQTARLFFRLPYHYAKMGHTIDKHKKVTYEAWRRGTDKNLTCRFAYRPVGNSFRAEPKSLTFFLVERYILFTATKNGIASGQVHHPPYPIFETAVTQWDANLLRLNHFDNPNRPPDNMLYSPGVDVDIYALKRL